MLDKRDFIPLYIQLRETLRKQITDGHYSINEELPSEPQLVDLYQVSRATVRRALDDLERDGLIRREQGRGTFVLPARRRHDLLGELSFAKEIMSRGLTPRSTVLEFRLEQATGMIAQKLRLNTGQQVLVVKRLRFAADEPLMIEMVHLPAQLVPGLVPLDLEDGILYEILADRYGLTVGHFDTEIEAVLLGKEEGELLRVGALVPALMVRRTVFASDGTPWVVSKRIVRGDRCTYVVKANE